jgi:hypothetical protein
MSYSNENNAGATGSKLDGALAKKMIEDLKTKKTKLKFDGCIWAIFDKDKLGKICNDPTVSQVKFFVGVFPDDSPPNEKDAPVIIMQVTKTTESLVATYEYQTGDTLCPPPNDTSCGPVEPPPPAGS